MRSILVLGFLAGLLFPALPALAQPSQAPAVAPELSPAPPASPPASQEKRRPRKPIDPRKPGGPGVDDSVEKRLRFGVAVPEFQGTSPAKADFGKLAAELLAAELARSERIDVTAKAGSTDCTSWRASVENGCGPGGALMFQELRQLGTDVIVQGSLVAVEERGRGVVGGLIGFLRGGRASSRTSFRIYLTDAYTGIVFASATFSGEASDQLGLIVGAGPDGKPLDRQGRALSDAIAKATPWILSELPRATWRASIVRAEAGRCVLNRGARDGLAVGDLLAVGRATVHLADPDRGQLLPADFQPRARIRLTDVHDTYSTCALESGEAIAIAEDSEVRLGGNEIH